MDLLRSVHGAAGVHRRHVAIAFVDLGRFNVAVALTIAIIQASLVLLYFMHLRYSSRLTVVFVLIALFWLATLIGISMTDVLSRGWFGAVT